MPEGTTA